MGLPILDWPSLTELAATCERLRRWDYLLTTAPLRFPEARLRQSIRFAFSEASVTTPLRRRADKNSYSRYRRAFSMSQG